MPYYDIFETSKGWMGVLASESGLRRTTLPQESPDLCYSLLGPEVVDATNEPDRFVEIRARLDRHFGGEPDSFEDLSLDLEDAPKFFSAAWRACRSIPRGETRTYQWLAAQAGNVRASRAAGQSMAKNRLPIIVPCHRVIGSDGGLTGFGKGAGQLDLKQRLLNAEVGSRTVL